MGLFRLKIQANSQGLSVTKTYRLQIFGGLKRGRFARVCKSSQNRTVFSCNPVTDRARNSLSTNSVTRLQKLSL